MPRSVTILDREDDWHYRGYKESIQIRALQPTLNRDQGRGKLPGCYDGIIAEFVAPGARRRVESDRGRDIQGWPAPQTQSQTQSPSRSQSPPCTQSQDTAGANPGPASPSSNITTPVRQRPDRPPGSRNSQTTAKILAPSTHCMITRRATQRDDDGRHDRGGVNYTAPHVSPTTVASGPNQTGTLTLTY